MIKPDAVKKGVIGKMIYRIEEAGFAIRAMRMATLTTERAQEFYAVHKERPFYGELVEFMTSGPVVMMVLEKENAIADLRVLMGATNSKEAAPGTLRQCYGTDIQENAIHGSDSPETAQTEIAFFEKYYNN